MNVAIVLSLLVLTLGVGSTTTSAAIDCLLDFFNFSKLHVDSSLRTSSLFTQEKSRKELEPSFHLILGALVTVGLSWIVGNSRGENLLPRNR